MHRETLSRGFLFSHNLMGKATIPLSCSRGIAVVSGKPSLSVFSRSSEASQSSKCFQASLRRNAHSITRTIMAEAKQKDETTASSSLPVDKKDILSQSQKQINISAKEILGTRDERSFPSLISTPQLANDPDQPSFSVSNRALLDSKIYSVQNVETLLNLSAEPALTLRHACMILSRLGTLAHVKHDAVLIQGLQEDKRFLRLLNLIQRGNHSQFPHTLLQALTVSLCF